MRLWTINPGTSFGSLTDKIADTFSVDGKPYTIQSVHFRNDFYKSHLPAALTSPQSPDIFHNWGGGSVASLVKAGQVVSLDDIEAELREIFLPVAFQPVTFKGKVYGVPYSGLAGVFFWYRKDIFRKYNLQPPKTWNEFLKVGEVLKNNGIIPLALANKNKWPGSFYYMYLVDRIGGPRLFSQALARVGGVTFADQPFITSGQLLQDLVVRGFFPKGFNRTEDEPGNWNSLIISGKAGMYLMGTWFLSALRKLPVEEREQFDFFTFPLVEGGTGNATSLVGSPGQDYLSINSACRDKNTAQQFLLSVISSKTYFRELAKQGFVPPVIDNLHYVSDPISRKVAHTYNEASHVQNYYDQVLPAKMAEAHKLLVHQLFELRLSPAKVAEKHEHLYKREADNLGDSRK